MSAGEKLLGAGALIMAVCCAVLPFAGAAVGGGLIAGAGTIGVLAGVTVLAGIATLIWRRHRAGSRC